MRCSRDLDLRTRVVIGAGVTLGAIVVWYAPHLDDIAVSALGEYGHQIDTAWLATAPIDQTIVPAMTLLDDAFVNPSLTSVLWAAAFALLIASSPLLRQRGQALILCSGVVATVIAFWFTGTYVVPRFFSFLLVPLFMLVASGSATVLGRVLDASAAPLRTTAVGLAGRSAYLPLPPPHCCSTCRFSREMPDATLPTRSVSWSRPRLQCSLTSRIRTIFEFHLGRAVTASWSPAEARKVCASETLAVYVDQPYLVPPASVSCTKRAGTRHYRFEQYARGRRIDLWVIPPAA